MVDVMFKREKVPIYQNIYQDAYIPTKGMYFDFEGVCILDFCQVCISETPGLKKKESRQSKISSHEPYKSTKVCIWGMCFFVEYQCTKSS